MKRKRNQVNDDTNNNCNEKKLRIEEPLAGNENGDEITEFDTSISKKEEFVLTREIAHNAILCDISGKQWRIGAPIGKGSFGEIYLASDNIAKPVEINSAPYVTKIEPHSNGPLFVEIHCLLNVNKQQQQELEENYDEQQEPANIESLGIPKYIASGSHFFNESRYRFLIMPRYKADLHSIIKIGRLSRKHFLIVARQIIDVLMHLHEKHYVHSDIKSENIMIGLYDYFNSSKSGFTHHTPIPLTNGYKKAVNKTPSVEFSGANPFRNCRRKDGSPPDKSHHTMYNDMVQSHYLRPGRAVVNYAADENSRSSHTHESDDESNNDDSDDDFRVSSRATKRKRRSNGKAKQRKASKSPTKTSHQQQFEQSDFHPMSKPQLDSDESEHVYLIDYGLATKFVDTNGEHRPFCMDQRRAHDGTLEFTSRDAHFGTHSRRSDLECLGYNLLFWSEGYLPWKDEKLKEQPELVHRLKEVFMTDVKEMLKLLYGKDVPKFLGDYMEYVGRLEFDEEPDYVYLKGLFEKEFIKLGYKKSDMKLNLSELREETEPCDRSISEHDLMMSRISDLKTVTKLGFLVTTDNVDGTETIAKPNESTNNLNISCKASPKNLRSKEKSAKVKRPKRKEKKLTEKELITEKMAKGKKLSIHEISLLDPDVIARDRADKEYEKFDEKLQTPTRYKGNPTYAILEIENKLKTKHGGSALLNNSLAVDIEPIKGYTKPMMDVLKKQQIMVEQQLSPISTFKKRSREGLRNVIKPTRKNLSFQKQNKSKKSKRKGTAKRSPTKSVPEHSFIQEDDEEEVPTTTPVSHIKPVIRKRGRPAKISRIEPIAEENFSERVSHDEDSHGSTSRTTDVAQRNRKRGRPRKIEVIQETPETEEDSVYYDIPGEGSSDGIKDISESEMDETDQHLPEDIAETSDDEIIKPIPKRLRKQVTSSEENSNHGSTISSGSNASKRKRRSRYEHDDDFEAYTDEASNISEVSHVTKSSGVSIKPRRARGNASHDSGIATRNKVNSRSTSRSAAISDEISEHSEQSEESEFEMDESENEETDEEQAVEYAETDGEEPSEDEQSNHSDASDEFDEDSDSIDIKYSPIKTRHARRRVNYMNVKQMRGRRLPNVMDDEDVRNFRLVSTRG